MSAEKFWFDKNLTEKNCVRKKFWSKKNLFLKKILVRKKCWFQKLFLVQIKFCQFNIFGSKKKFGLKKNPKSYSSWTLQNLVLLNIIFPRSWTQLADGARSGHILLTPGNSSKQPSKLYFFYYLLRSRKKVSREYLVINTFNTGIKISF